MINTHHGSKQKGGKLDGSGKQQPHHFETAARMVCVAVTVEIPVMMQSGCLVMGLSEQCAKPANPPEGFSPDDV